MLLCLLMCQTHLLLAKVACMQAAGPHRRSQRMRARCADSGRAERARLA